MEQDELGVDVPGERELRDVATEFFSDLGKTSDLLDLSLALRALQGLDGALKEVLVGGETAVLGNAFVVLAGEEATGERRPDGGAILVLVKKWFIFYLESLAVEGVVLRLLGDGRNEIVPTEVSDLSIRNRVQVNSLLGDLSSLHDLDSRPLGSPPVVGHVEVADNLGEALHNLLHRGADIRPVSEHNVHVGLLQPFQRALEALDDVLLA
jgi:hypothetical protein